MKENNIKNNENAAMKVSVISMAANFLLTIFKLLAGLFANSAAMVSDAVHSASDVFSTIVVMIGIKISEKDADEEHPYGHERLECVCAVLLSVMLAIVGFGIGKKGVEGLISKSYLTSEAPGILAIVAAVVSILIKEAMFHYTMHTAVAVKSAALKADAWHHRSDALSSIGALIGIGGAMLGYGIADIIASLVICIFILKAAVEIFIEGVNGMVDHACDEELVKNIDTLIRSIPGVVRVDELKTRMFGAKMYVDVEIAVDGNLTLNEAHKIAHSVHDKIEGEFLEVKHCQVHENPA